MLDNWKDTLRGVVHLGNSAGGYEYTLCGYAFDEPSSEHGAECMSVTTEVCTCEDCIRIAEEMLPYLRYELRRVSRDKSKRNSHAG